MVEFDPAINNAIRRLRDALGESAEKPRYIETVARRGYRFLGEVEAVETAASEPLASEPPAAGRPESDTDELEGKAVPHYLVLGKLSAGGMGIVFRRQRPESQAKSSAKAPACGVQPGCPAIGALPAGGPRRRGTEPCQYLHHL